MKILVTRPFQDGEETARALAALGHRALLAPLLDTQFHSGPPIVLDDVQAILATSANGVRALARRSDGREVPVFAVGPQTAAEAQAAGFRTVRNADGDARALAAAVMRWASPDKGALLHVAGDGNDGALAAALRESGFTVRQDILYAVTAVSRLPPEAASALRNQDVDAALFFSPRSAAVFRDFVTREGLGVERLTAACISAATAAALAPLVPGRTLVAAAPNQAALLALLG